ncbi:hypothetical protein ACFY4C_38200 [Actinomadura viridis]|uniref:hypothetical protein n=1 Tax=Actinomadura viridis TaxID=58110 RepID=UPI0036A74AA7
MNSVAAVGFLAFSIYASPILVNSGDAVLGALLLVFCSLFVIAVAVMAAAAYRRSFWIEDGLLWRRGFFRNKVYDLQFCTVSLKAKSIGFAGSPVPVLVISAPNKRAVRLWLRNREARFAMLPREQIYALADLIASARSRDDKASAVAQSLRYLVDSAI